MQTQSQALKADDRLPRYLQIRDDLSRRIGNAEWMPDQAIPTEFELTEQYQVSTGTVRKAVELLVSEGTLTRSQGKGTFIRRPRFDSSLFRFFRFKSRTGESVRPSAKVLRREIVAAGSAAATALRLGSNELAIHLTRIRLIDQHPVLAEEIWLPLKGFEAIATMDMAAFEDLLYPQYERECRQVVASATETLRVESANGEAAELLKLKPGSPLILVQRIAYDYAARPIEWRATCAAADGFEYQVEIR